ncbi:MAG: ABC transporter ATP-binding protein [Candidatus Limnocylindrales bacterium]
MPVLRQISFDVPDGSVTALIGPNGAGKTTTLRCLSGLLSPSHGRVVLAGRDITGMAAHEISELGLIQVPEGRRLFPAMTVRENLQVGGAMRRSRRTATAQIDKVLELFPVLADRASQVAGTLSGGEQQMVAIGRALMAEPRLLVLDEPSLGLAPLVIEEVFRTIQRLQAMGVTILLVEQAVRHALQLSDRAYVLEHGQVVLSGAGADLSVDDRIRRAYLGG